MVTKSFSFGEPAILAGSRASPGENISQDCSDPVHLHERFHEEDSVQSRPSVIRGGIEDVVFGRPSLEGGDSQGVRPHRARSDVTCAGPLRWS